MNTQTPQSGFLWHIVCVKVLSVLYLKETGMDEKHMVLLQFIVVHYEVIYLPTINSTTSLLVVLLIVGRYMTPYRVC